MECTPLTRGAVLVGFTGGGAGKAAGAGAVAAALGRHRGPRGGAAKSPAGIIKINKHSHTFFFFNNCLVHASIVLCTCVDVKATSRSEIF